MIQVRIPASVPLKEFDYNVRVELINPIAVTVTTVTYQGADVDWCIKADDIVLTKDSKTAKYYYKSYGSIKGTISADF